MRHKRTVNSVMLIALSPDDSRSVVDCSYWYFDTGLDDSSFTFLVLRLYVRTTLQITVPITSTSDY